MPVVTTNTAANSALRYLNANSSAASSSVSKLASGSRIVKASDDAAGLAISTRLKSDIGVQKQASVNASQGASVLQVADGGLARITDVLQRMKVLAAQSLSGVPSNTERGFIDAEYQQLMQEIDGIAETTRFNGQSMLDGSGDFGGLASGETYGKSELNIGSAATDGGYGTGVDFFVGAVATDVININLTTDEVANQSDAALEMRTANGTFAGGTVATYNAGTTDYAFGDTGFTTQATQAESGLLQQGNFSSMSFTGTITRKSDSGTEAYAVMQLGNTNVKSQFAARDAMDVIDDALNTVSKARATVGAQVSRFDFRGQQLATSTENVEAANSVIADVDLAAEQSKLVSSNVLVQASVSALSQANQLPQQLLRVLQ